MVPETRCALESSKYKCNFKIVEIRRTFRRLGNGKKGIGCRALLPGTYYTVCLGWLTAGAVKKTKERNKDPLVEYHPTESPIMDH
jgi:hypothetical protein